MKFSKHHALLYPLCFHACALRQFSFGIAESGEYICVEIRRYLVDGEQGEMVALDLVEARLLLVCLLLLLARSVEHVLRSRSAPNGAGNLKI